MNAFKRLKERFIPVEQPIDFHRLYFIPDTYQVDAPRRSDNGPSYRPSPPPTPSSSTKKLKREPLIQGFIRRKKEAIQQSLLRTRDRAWRALKAFGRSVARWLAWRVFIPLSVACALWIPSIYPMDLPL